MKTEIKDALRAQSQVKEDTFLVALRETARVQRLIDDAAEKMNKRKSGISQSLLELAKNECAGDSKNFLGRCAVAEESYKEQTGKNIPKQWSQAKSNIKAALAAGLNLGDYGTESSMRKALLDERKKAKKRQEDEARKEEQAAMEWQAFEASRIKRSLDKVDDDRRREALQMINEFVKQVELLAGAPVTHDVEGVVIEGEALRTA